MNVYVPPIIEKVYNIQGSTAAPGSGEYHRYRALRRRERTIAVVMEKEYKEREIQKEFEEEKEIKRSKLEEITQRKKKRRDKKKLLKKAKIKNEKKKKLFDPNIPLIDQLKQEIGNEEYDRLFNQPQRSNDEYDNDYNMLYDNGMNDSTIKPNMKPLIVTKENDNMKIQLNSENENENENENESNHNKDLKKLFPVAKDDELEFDNYEDYEDHLEELKILEEKKIKDEKANQIKIKEVDQIIVHDEE